MPVGMSGFPYGSLDSATLLTYFTFLDIFVLLGPASRSNQEEMLGFPEECLPRGQIFDKLLGRSTRFRDCWVPRLAAPAH